MRATYPAHITCKFFNCHLPVTFEHVNFHTMDCLALYLVFLFVKMCVRVRKNFVFF